MPVFSQVLGDWSGAEGLISKATWLYRIWLRIRVSVANGYAYVANVSGLQVIDISTPTAPVIVGSVDTPGAAGVSVANGYAYVANGSGSAGD